MEEKKLMKKWAKSLRRISFELSIIEGALFDFNCSNLGTSLRDIGFKFVDVIEEMESSVAEEEE